MKKTRYEARWFIRTPWEKYSFYLQIGPEKISEHSDELTRKNYSSLVASFFYLSFFSWCFIAMILLSVIALYILKNKLGIDLIDGSHPFSTIIYNLGLCF